MNRKARATIEQFAMLRQGDTVIAAVSGGADSVALLDFLCSLAGLSLTVRACHLNHCLRGEESDRDEQLVRTMCQEYGVPLDVKRVEIRPLAGKRGTSIEETARDERYAFFAALQKQHGGRVATAHTLSDTAETVLLNLARGTGIAGLAGIPPVRDYLIRPLIACSRAEIEQYCYDHGLCFVTDSTNLSCDYTRNHIRQNVLPQLNRVNPAALTAIGRMTDALRQDADYLAGQAREERERLAKEGGIDALALAARHPAIRSRVIADLLAANGIERSAERIALIEGMLGGKGKSVLQVGRGDYVTVQRGILRLERRERHRVGPLKACQFQKEALDGLRVPLGCGKTIEFSRINCADYEIFENNTESVLKNAVDYDKIKTDIFLRSRAPGDRIRPVGRGCSKPLRKLMNELMLAGRESLCVIADSGGVLFCEGIGADERVKIDGGTKTVLTFAISTETTEGSGNEG
ncbi:tRNA lysidine(34) synthetase TilS [Anaerotruncus sp. AF02-27]|jgi:tRNA(Ile)-lysidine synthase|uniref:tRNA lysidine(34) synthetase TilS n=1 Tax=Anaerotruncus TaxID=244127 RepID=UPI000FF6964D|nr:MULTISPECIES: tRNA lysidine(34) synthetase TilS [Anaerotruncus]RGX54870.1 tRNA lysidine(34) synthetase TilS [Anaerotruncus sp. AF02-27]